MAFSVIAGQTDYTTLIRIVDSTGQPITGLDDTDIALNYTRVETDNDVTEDAASPAALTALTDAHTDWGFKEVNATEAPGVYRLDIGDAALATGAWSAAVTLVDAGANDITPVSLLFDLTAVPANVTQVASVAVSGSTPDVNIASVDGSTAAATTLKENLSVCVDVTASGTPSTSVIACSDAPDRADDAYYGRWMFCTSSTASPSNFQIGRRIKTYVETGKEFTTEEWPTAPEVGDTFRIV